MAELAGSEQAFRPGDPVAAHARYVAAAFREKGLPDVAEMIDYLADRADLAWRADQRAVAD